MYLQIFVIPMIIGVDGRLLPSTLVATTLTITVVEGGQEEEVSISKLWVHSSPTHDEAGMLAMPQLLPNVESRLTV